MWKKYIIVLIVFGLGCSKKKEANFEIRYESALTEEMHLIDSLGSNMYMIANITDSMGNELLKYNCAKDDTIRVDYGLHWRVSISTGKKWCNGMHDYFTLFNFSPFQFFLYEDGDIGMQFPAFCDSTIYQDAPVSYQLLWFRRHDAPNQHHYFLDSSGNLSLIVKTPYTKEFYLLKPIR